MNSSNRASFRQTIFLGLLATVLSVFFVFLGGPVLRVLFSTCGAIKYSLLGLAFSIPFFAVGMAPLGFFSLGLWTAIGFFSGAEARGKTGFWWASLAVGLGVVVSVLGPLAHFQLTGIEIVNVLGDSVHEVTRRWAQQTSSQMTAEEVKELSNLSVKLLPGFVAILMMGSLGVAVIFAEKFAQLTGIRYERVAGQMKISGFRVPDLVIWILLAGLLLSFVKLGSPEAKVLGINLTILCLGAYFFQGLAVLEAGFEAFNVYPIVRLLLYVFVVAQLFFLLSILGLIDFWLDFRKKWQVYKRLSHSSEE